MQNSENVNYNKNYNDYICSIAPKTKEARSLIRAFWVGGVICCIGQFIRFAFETWLGLTGDELAAFVSVVLIFLGGF